MSSEGYKEAYELMEQIYENFSLKDKLWFTTSDPSSMHLGLGMHLRNHAKLWTYPWEPEIDPILGSDNSPNHPDAISNQVIKDFQTQLLNKEAK